MSIEVVVFWVMTSFSDAIGYQLFGGPCCLHDEDSIVNHILISHIPTQRHNPEDHDLISQCVALVQ